MQQITDLLRQTGGIESIACELGLTESQAASGAAALLPALLGGFKKHANAQPGGIDGLLGMLGGMGGGGLLEQVLAPKATNVAPGNDILGQVFGTPDVSRTVALSASARSGLDPALLKKMLPLLAMVIAGFMAKGRGGAQAAPQSSGGGLSDVLGGGPAGGGGLGDLLGGVLGGGRAGSLGGSLGGLASMLDLDGDGNPLDDILNMASGRR